MNEDDYIVMAVMITDSGVFEIAEGEAVDDLTANQNRELAKHLMWYADQLMKAADDMDAERAKQ